MEYNNNTIYKIDEIKTIVNNIIKEYYPMINKVILFGSYACGKAEGNSDLDLVILDSPDFKRLKTTGFRYLLMNQTGKDVDLFIEKNIDKNSQLYKNMINQGVVM